MNPTFNRVAIDRDFQDDPVRALSEYGRDGHMDWRKDITSLFTLDALTAATAKHVLERPYDDTIRYRAFVDPAGGSGADSMTLAIAYTDRQSKREVLAATFELSPPFSPQAGVKEFSDHLKRYHVQDAWADRWGSEFVREAFAAHGIRLETAPWSKSEMYLMLLPMLNSGLVDLTDDPKAVRQFTSLERSADGKVDHPPRQHDDRANVIAGAVVMGRQSQGEYRVRIVG
jgi:hypothetical protein